MYKQIKRNIKILKQKISFFFIIISSKFSISSLNIFQQFFSFLCFIHIFAFPHNFIFSKGWIFKKKIFDEKFYKFYNVLYKKPEGKGLLSYITSCAILLSIFQICFSSISKYSCQMPYAWPITSSTCSLGLNIFNNF